MRHWSPSCSSGVTSRDKPSDIQTMARSRPSTRMSDTTYCAASNSLKILMSQLVSATVVPSLRVTRRYRSWDVGIAGDHNPSLEEAPRTLEMKRMVAYHGVTNAHRTWPALRSVCARPPPGGDALQSQPSPPWSTPRRADVPREAAERAPAAVEIRAVTMSSRSVRGWGPHA
jgi:hypothetical protein